MTNSLRDRRKQLLRDEILDVARSLLAEKGYNAMSMDELATQVGISKPTLYNHFATKEALVAEAVAREMDRLTLLTQSNEEQHSPLQRLLHLLRTLVFLQLREGRLMMRAWLPELHEALHVHPGAQGAMQRFDAAIVDLVQAGRDAGEIDPSLDFRTVVHSFYGMLGSIRITALRATDMDSLDHESIAATLETIFKRGVRP